METADIISRLEAAPALIAELVRETPQRNRKRRPAPDRWSVHEHACHLAEVHPLFFERLDRMLREENPVIVPYDPPPEEQTGSLLERDLDQELQRFTADRAKLVRRLRELSPDDWKRRGEHGDYKPYSVAIMFRHVMIHDYFHAYRIEELALKKDWA